MYKLYIVDLAIKRFNLRFRNTSWYPDNWKPIEEFLAIELFKAIKKVDLRDKLHQMLDESTVDGTTNYELFAEKVISLLDTSSINTKLGLKTSSICTKPGKTTSTIKGKFKYKIGGEK